MLKFERKNKKMKWGKTMVQINYGAKQEKGFIEVLSTTLNFVLEQSLRSLITLQRP